MNRTHAALATAAALGGLVVLVASSAVGSSGSATRTETHWVISDLGAGIAVDINERGQVVGGGAFIWQDGRSTPLGTLGGPSSSVVAINDQGEVIGGSLTRKPIRGHAFFWQHGEMTDLGTLGGRRSGARAINERGQVAGSSTTATGREHAFLWEKGKMRDLGTLGGPSSIAIAINDRGLVVGSSTTASGREHAFLWQRGRMRDLGTLGEAYAAGSGAVDINERGQIVGSSYSATISYGQLGAGVHAFLWQNEKMRDLGTLGRNPPTSTAVAINDRGEIIGNSPATGDWGPFLWRNGKLINLGTLPGGSHSEAVAINNRSQVIGDSIPRGPHGMSHAFVWQNGTMTDLGTLGGFVSVPTAINEHGQIVGGSNTAGGKGRAVLWTLKRGNVRRSTAGSARSDAASVQELSRMTATKAPTPVARRAAAAMPSICDSERENLIGLRPDRPWPRVVDFPMPRIRDDADAAARGCLHADVMRALVIVDMLEDFVHGALANPRADSILDPLQRLLAYARSERWAIVFSNDAHEPGDPELAIWGPHAMAGTSGAEVVRELEPRPDAREFQCPKRAYGAFDGTDLDARLRALGVDEVVLTGQHTHICVRHTAYGALLRGYTIVVPSDAVCAFDGVDEEDALSYLQSVYGARVTTVAELMHRSSFRSRVGSRWPRRRPLARRTRAGHLFR